MIIHKTTDVNGMFKREYAFTLTKLGTAKEEMDKLDEALQCYTTAMQITKELLAASPDDGKLKYNMSVSYEQSLNTIIAKLNCCTDNRLRSAALTLSSGLDRLMKTLLQVRYTDLVHFRCSERQQTNRKNALKKR